MLTWLNTAWDFKAAPPEVALFPLACFEPMARICLWAATAS